MKKMHFLIIAYIVHIVSYWATVAMSVYRDSSQWDTNCALRVWSNQTVFTLPFVAIGTFVWHSYAHLNVWHAPWQIPGCVLLTDILFYYPHRAMHSKWLYPLHKHHHMWTRNIGMAALYAHPLEHIFVNVAPPFLAGVLLRCHPVVLAMWVAIASMNTVFAHAKDGQHADHHRHWTKNFGVGLMLCDRFHGTFLHKN